MNKIFILFLLFHLGITTANMFEEKCTDNNQMWTNQSGVCVHKDLFPFVREDAILTIVVISLSIFSSMAGIGGGGILIPTYILLGGFETYYAIPLTVITIGGSSLIRLLILVNKTHPHNYKKYLIDYGIIFLIVPFDANTSFIGFILNTISPNWLILASVVIILSVITYKTFTKGLSEYRRESYRMRNKNINQIIIDGIAFPVHRHIMEVDGIELEVTSDEYKKAVNNYPSDKSMDRVKYFGIIICIFTITNGFTFIRKYLTEVCKAWYWGVYAIQFFVVLSMGILIARYNIRTWEKRREEGYQIMQGEIHWDKKTTMKYAGISSAVGAISTYLGIGGGMITGPFFLQIGMLPEVVAATNSVTTFFSALASSFQYFGTDRVLTYYSLYFFLLSGFSSIIGLKLSSIISRKFNRKSFIVFVLAGLIGISTILLVILGIMNIEEDVNAGKSFGFKNFC